MAKQPHSKPYALLLGALFTLSCFAQPSTTWAANGDSFSILRQGADLSHCLNAQSSSVSFETQTTSDGAIQELTHVTHISTGNDPERLSECIQQHHSCSAAGVVIPLAIRTREIESHSAWDASDRMRLTDLIVQSLTEEAEATGHFIAANDGEETEYHLALIGKASQTPDLVLETQIRYFGKLMSTEPLNVWFAPSHSALLEMRLMDRRNGKTFATRTIKVSLPLTLRTRDTSGSTDRRWLTLVQNSVEQQGMELLENFKCAPQLLSARAISENNIQVQLRGVRGLNVGQGMILVPSNQFHSSAQNSPAGFPIIRLTRVDELRAQGELISGNNEACRQSECIAIPL